MSDMICKLRGVLFVSVPFAPDNPMMISFTLVGTSEQAQLEAVKCALDMGGVDAIISNGLVVPLWVREWQCAPLAYGIQFSLVTNSGEEVDDVLPWIGVFESPKRRNRSSLMLDPRDYHQ